MTDLPTQRDFTMTEEADISCFKADDLKIEMIGDDMVWITRTSYEEHGDTFSVQIFAVADNVYVAHQCLSSQILFSDNLKDILTAAAEMIYTA